MKKLFPIAVFSAALMFVACGDDSSSGPEEESSSSIEVGDESSSSVEKGKSSAADKKSSSSEAKKGDSSSSDAPESSAASSSSVASSSSLDKSIPYCEIKEDGEAYTIEYGTDFFEGIITGTTYESFDMSIAYKGIPCEEAVQLGIRYWAVFEVDYDVFYFDAPECSEKENGYAKQSVEYMVDPEGNGWNKKNIAENFCNNFMKGLEVTTFLDTKGETCDASSVGTIIEGKAIATNKYYCTEYGWRDMKEWSFGIPKEYRFNPSITYGTLEDDRDKKTYRTVKIGDQVWMAENLNYADSTKTPNLKGSSWCYNNNSKNCDVGGRLYTWAAAIDSFALANAEVSTTCGYGASCTLPVGTRGICPEGWHLPSEDEIKTLLDFLGGEDVAGPFLRSQTGWNPYNWVPTGTDAYGFSGIPVGEGNGAEFSNAGELMRIWSFSEYDYNPDYNARMLTLYSYNEGAYLSGNSKDGAFSVRCIQDAK